MKLLDTAPRRNRLAIASSIALHLCALLVALMVPWPVLTPRVETQAIPVSLTIVERRQPALPHALPGKAIPAAAPATGKPPPLPAIEPVRAAHRPEATMPVAAARHELSRPVTTPAAPAAPAVVAAVAHPAAVAPAASTAARTPPVTVAPASPAAAPAAESATTNGGGGGGGNAGLFSASYPPAPQQTNAFEAIRALLPARMRLRVTVDENGHAAVVDWLTPPPDAALADSIRAKLMALPYIPAECDGLPCTGIISLAT